jgi:hypothetical protein
VTDTEPGDKWVVSSKAPTVAALVPVLGRPQSARPLAESFYASEFGVDISLWFICSPDDGDQTAAAHEAAGNGGGVIMAPWPAGIRGDYARKINLGLWMTDDPFVLCGADDLRFDLAWADVAVAQLENDETGFCGTNDLANPLVMKGRHATHPVVRRSYALECGTIDTPGLIYHEGYWHQYVDNEATGTAMHRNCWSFAEESIVRHKHPIFDRSVKQDDTYRHGQLHTDEDRKLSRQRQPLWGGDRR